MAIAKIHNTLNTSYSQALVRANATTYKTLQWAMSGIANPDVSGINAKYDRPMQPVGLGTGVYVTTAGRWLLDPAYGPVSQFLVVNSGTTAIYAGINAAASGAWGVSSGLSIPPSGSFEFGEPGTQIVRNVWAMSDSGNQLVQGYATNLLNWI